MTNASSGLPVTRFHEIQVNLSDNQKKNLARALKNKEAITLRLTAANLSGNDNLYVPMTTLKRLAKNRLAGKGMDIKLSKTNIRKQVGGSLLSSLMKLAPLAAPVAKTIAKTVGLSALAGLASEAGSQAVKKFTGNGYEIPFNNLRHLLPHQEHLTKKQLRDLAIAAQSGSGMKIKPTKKQTGGFLLLMKFNTLIRSRTS